MTETVLVKGVTVRTDDRGGFDELVTKSVAAVHVEMMSDKQMWMRIDRFRSEVGVVLVATVKRGKLHVTVSED